VHSLDREDFAEHDGNGAKALALMSSNGTPFVYNAVINERRPTCVPR